jgi:hypothetical protein
MPALSVRSEREVMDIVRGVCASIGALLKVTPKMMTKVMIKEKDLFKK